ncbi:MAG: hypothetical protein Q8O13_10775 [Candidatus Omnitrophota bacterium]|nr:hypothetical protein [Candidatus Omnitrophota bacterium]
MSEVLALKNAVQDFVSSYEMKIENVGSLFETTHLILNEFQEPLLKTKQVREEISVQLQDLLAKNEHLRRKDFDRMMQSILFAQIEKEKEIRNLVNSYLTEQKEMINLLREHLAKIKDAIAKGESVGAQESQNTLTQIIVQQDRRKEEITSKLKEFQKEQRETTERLLGLLAKGRGLRIKDLKAILKEFKASHRERLARQEERKVEVQKRKEEVRDMLVEFKKKRKNSLKNWKANLPKAIPPVSAMGGSASGGRKAEEAAEDDKISNGVHIVVKEGLTK